VKNDRPTQLRRGCRKPSKFRATAPFWPSKRLEDGQGFEKLIGKSGRLHTPPISPAILQIKEK
jgi:hypothetical protein